MPLILAFGKLRLEEQEHNVRLGYSSPMSAWSIQLDHFLKVKINSIVKIFILLSLLKSIVGIWITLSSHIDKQIYYKLNRSAIYCY